jgi:hypothetical protein
VTRKNGTGARLSTAGAEMLREVFSQGVFRELIGLVDTGRTMLAQVYAEAGAAYVVDEHRRDVLVRVRDVFSRFPVTARLFVPANILWRAPRADETCVVLTPADCNTPGGPVALYGDGGAANAVPAWLGADRCGIYAPETVRVESRNANVELEGATIKLGPAATKSVTRQGDTVDCGTLVFTPNVGTAPAVLAWVAPGGTVPPLTGPMVAIPITGRVGPGSAKVKAED